MSRALQSLLGLALFIGLGYVTRHYYREWLNDTIKRASEESAKETAKWKAASTNFSNIKFDKSMLTPPKIDMSKFGRQR